MGCRNTIFCLNAHQKHSCVRFLTMFNLRIYLLLAFFFFSSAASFSQDEDIFGITRKARSIKSESSLGNTFRNLKEMVSFQVATGAAQYTMNTKFYSGDGNVYPITQYQNHEFGYAPLPDTLTLKSSQWVFPSVEGGVRINLFNLLTVGASYGMEKGKLAPMRGGDYNFSFASNRYSLNSYRISAGLVLYDASRRNFLLKLKYKKYNDAMPDLKMRKQREYNQRIRQYYPWTVSIEGEVGKFVVNNPVIQNVILSDLRPFNDFPFLRDAANSYTYAAGLRIEYDLSDYVSVYVKGRMELRSFENNAPEFYPFHLNQQNIGIQTGLSMKLSGTKRCKINGCGVVMKHKHDGIEYRGSSIFNFQNRKIGQWY